MKKTKSKLKSKLTKKFRLVVLNEASFEERFSFKLTRLNVFVFGGVFSILLVGITVFIIAFTPIKEYIPGYSSTKLKKQASFLFYKVDSLQAQVNTLTKFTAAMRPILVGEDTIVDVDLPYKNLETASSENLKFPVRNDSIASLIAKVRKEMDSTYKAYYKNETNLLQKKHQGVEVSLQDLHKKNLEELKLSFETTVEQQRDSIQKLQLQLLDNTKQISALNKQMALKEIEAKHNLQSLSKDNKKAISSQEKNTEQVKKELRNLLEKEYRENEKNLVALHEKELTQLNATLFSKEAVIDSLTFQLVAQQQKKIGELANEKPFKEVDKADEEALVISSKDSIFREEVERQDRFNLFDFETSHKDDVVFFAPVKGIITDGFDVKEKHFAVDVAVTKGTGVKAVADGTIIFAEWNAETGYVVIIEHTNKYVSVYKHNETLYRNQGDLVKSGEVISMAGSTGEYSTGPHLHFEMWYQGYSVNPTNFIEFE
ncbi:M23 family metallopeptidase [Flavicella marina]|uniref:M23 family metallopeptidase n=1 Tax=Flavicella marina TaxID=1475951 RepID=UPI001264FD6E|nr:M23 family metallopeptidase [Flavicella marina]